MCKCDLSCERSTLSNLHLCIHADEWHVSHPNVDAPAQLIGVFVVLVDDEDRLLQPSHRIIHPQDWAHKVLSPLELVKDMVSETWPRGSIGLHGLVEAVFTEELGRKLATTAKALQLLNIIRLSLTFYHKILVFDRETRLAQRNPVTMVIRSQIETQTRFRTNTV